MAINITPEIIDAFDKLRKVYLLEKFENLSEGTEDILKSNLQNEDYLMDIKSTIELIIESKFENNISEFEDLFDLQDLNEELELVRAYLIDLLKGDPDVECIQSYIIFNAASGLVKFGWNDSIFKKSIEDLAVLFILSKMPSLILIKRMNQFTAEVQIEYGELFLKMDHIDFTYNEDVKAKIYDIMVQNLKFDKKSLTEIN